MKHVQINLQSQFGGGEVYTTFFCRALSQFGVATTLLVHPRAGFWDRLGLPADTERVAVAERCHANVMACHTYAHRVATLREKLLAWHKQRGQACR